MVKTSIWAAAAAFSLLVCGPAFAEGQTRVHQIDGSIQVYDHVRMELRGHVLRLHSPDRRGVYEIASDACSFTGELERCLAYSTTLRQHGKTHEIALEHGAVYVNRGDTAQQMPHSTESIGPRGVVVLLHTARGTYVTVKGTLDEIE